MSIKITEVERRKVIAEFDYSTLIELGLERFLRTGTLYGKGTASVITEEPFWFAAATEYLKEHDRYIKHAGFPVVVMKDEGPSVLVPLYIASPLYDRRNIWATKKISAVPAKAPKIVPREEQIAQVKNELLKQYYEVEATKAVIEKTLKGLNKMSSELKGEALEELEKETPININFDMSTELLESILNEITNTSSKYQKILLKVFKRTTGGKPVERMDWEKAFNILADNWKMTEKVRKQFADQAKEIVEVAEKTTTVVQPKLVDIKEKKSKMAGVLEQIGTKFIGWLKGLIQSGKRFLGRLTGLESGLDEVDVLLGEV